MPTPRIYLILALLAAIALPATAQKTHIDFDGATAFNQYKTFQFQEARRDLRKVSPSLHEDVIEQLVGYLAEGGLSQVDEDPDVYVTYFVADQGNLEVSLTDLRYAYGPQFSPGSYWEGGVGTRDVSRKVYTFKEGTVIVDVWDREREILVWRGMATKGLKGDYHKNEKRLAKALKKLMSDWDEMMGGRARALRRIQAENER
jgi:hypothetical protein